MPSFTEPITAGTMACTAVIRISGLHRRLKKPSVRILLRGTIKPSQHEDEEEELLSE